MDAKKDLISRFPQISLGIRQQKNTIKMKNEWQISSQITPISFTRKDWQFVQFHHLVQ